MQALSQIKSSKFFSGSFFGFGLASRNTHTENDVTCVMRPFLPNAWIVLDENKFNLPSIDKTYQSIDPVMSLGYAFSRNNWYFGIIGEISLGRRKTTYKDLYNKLSATSELSGFSSSLKLKAGYHFTNSNILAYGLAGLKWQNQNVQIRFHCQDVDIPDFYGSKVKLSNPIWIVGLGIERPIRNKLSMFAQYEYSWKTSKSVDTLKGYKGTDDFYIKQQLKEHCFKFGLNYYIQGKH